MMARYIEAAAVSRWLRRRAAFYRKSETVSLLHEQLRARFGDAVPMPSTPAELAEVIAAMCDVVIADLASEVEHAVGGATPS